MEPLRVHTVVISVNHTPDITVHDIRQQLLEKVVKAVIPARYLDDKTIYHLLPSGKFLDGGPQVGASSPHKTQECCDVGADVNFTENRLMLC